jgi:hypothetical protein
MHDSTTAGRESRSPRVVPASILPYHGADVEDPPLRPPWGPGEPLDLGDAGGAVGPEHQAEQLGHEVVVLPASGRILELGAHGAGREVLFPAARAHLAPGRLRVLVAARAFPAQMGSAGAAVQPAIGDEFPLRCDVSHLPFLLPLQQPEALLQPRSELRNPGRGVTAPRAAGLSAARTASPPRRSGRS